MNNIEENPDFKLTEMVAPLFPGPSCLVEHDSKTRVLSCNSALAELFKTSENTLKSDGFFPFNRETMIPATRRQIENLLSSESSFIADVLDKDESNNRFWTRVSIFALGGNRFLGFQRKLDDSPDLEKCAFSFPIHHEVPDSLKQLNNKIHESLLELKHKDEENSSIQTAITQLSENLPKLYEEMGRY